MSLYSQIKTASASLYRDVMFVYFIATVFVKEINSRIININLKVMSRCCSSEFSLGFISPALGFSVL